MQHPKIIEKKNEIASLLEEINILTRKKDLAQSNLDGMLLIFNEHEASPPQKASNMHRRKRLGAKKRVIFTLIQSGFETLAAINNAIDKSTIDPRYTREVVRGAIQSHDLLGEVDDKFILSDGGKALLKSASVPADWDIYRDAIAIAVSTKLDTASARSKFNNSLHPSTSGGLSERLKIHKYSTATSPLPKALNVPSIKAQQMPGVSILTAKQLKE